MRPIVEAPLQPGLIDEQRRGLGAFDSAVPQQKYFHVILAACHAGGHRDMGPEQGVAEEFHPRRRFPVQALIGHQPERRLAERFDIMMGMHRTRLQIGHANAIARQHRRGRDLRQRPAAGEVIIGRHAVQAGGVMVDPYPRHPVAPPHRQRRVRPAHHHHDIAACRLYLTLDIAEHHDVAAGIVGGDLDQILADAGDKIFLRQNRRNEKQQGQKSQPHQVPNVRL